ncbi:hypothetical protein [Azospirillum doebereinerae]
MNTVRNRKDSRSRRNHETKSEKFIQEILFLNLDIMLLFRRTFPRRVWLSHSRTFS